MNLLPLLIAVSAVSGGIITALGVALVGIGNMYRAARKTNDDAFHIISTAITEKQEVERKFKEYQNQIAEWVKKPVEINAVLTDDQAKRIAESVKGSSAEIVWPAKKVN